MPPDESQFVALFRANRSAEQLKPIPIPRIQEMPVDQQALGQRQGAGLRLYPAQPFVNRPFIGPPETGV
jgi:hypothetical protein